MTAGPPVGGPHDDKRFISSVESFSALCFFMTEDPDATIAH